jgi:hypothetical protein
MDAEAFMVGLDETWFGRHFESWSLFGYIGDRTRVLEYQHTKSLVRKLIELVAPKINIVSLMGKLSGLNIGAGNSESEVAKAIIDLINEEENKRLIYDFLLRAQAHCQSEGRSFDAVEEQLFRTNSVMSGDQRKLDGHLVVVDAQLLNRQTVHQYAPKSAAQLARSSEEWILSDFPPNNLDERNSSFKGNLLRLREDKGFSETFAEYLPFCRRIGWYPYCRVTGFYDSSTRDTEIFPRMSLAFVEYKRPKLYQEVGTEILDFLQRETSRPIYLASRSDRVTATYLLPIVTWASNLKEYRVPSTAQSGVGAFVTSVGNDMPTKLIDWYQNSLA